MPPTTPTPAPLREAFREGARNPQGAPAFWGTLSALAATAVLGTGAALVLVDPLRGLASRLDEPPVPLGTWALELSLRAQAPAVEQHAQVLALGRVGAGVASLVALLAVLGAAALWRQRVRVGEDAYALHRALGAERAHRAARVVGEAAPWAGRILATSLALLLLGPLAVLLTFPGTVRLSPGVAAALIPLFGLATLLLHLEVRAGRGASGGRRAGGTLPPAPLTSSPAALMGLGFAALSGVGLLARHSPDVSAEAWSGAAARARPVVLAAGITGAGDERAGAALAWWAALRAEGIDAGLASAGTVRGAGRREVVATDCGRCSEGGLPLPIHVVRAEVFALAPDSFRHVGLALLDGRDLRAEGDADVTAPGVLVTRALAARHFERGRAVGRQLRVGGSGWVGVVGVVSDPPGTSGAGAYAVYVPVGWAAPSEVEVIVATSPAAVGPVRALAPPGVTVGAPRSLADVFAVHAWFRGLLALLGAAGLVLAFAGTWAAAAGEAAALRYEFALRKAVGAGPGALARFAAAAGARQLLVGVGVGAWLSLFLGAGLMRAYPTVPQVDLGVWGGAAAWVTLAFVLGSVPGYRRAVRGSALEGLGETAGG